MREEISKYQKKLRLSNNLMNIYPRIKAESNEEFLLQLLKELYEDRDEKRKIRNLNNAGFLVVKSLKEYDYTQIRFPDSLQIQDLETLSFLDRKENLILYGSVGTGNYRKFYIIKRNERLVMKNHETVL